MTVCTITIADAPDNEVHLEGKLDDPSAIGQPPTPALIIGTYIAAHSDAICKDAMRWFNRDVPKGDIEVEGAPV